MPLVVAYHYISLLLSRQRKFGKKLVTVVTGVPYDMKKKRDLLRQRNKGD